MDAAFDTIRQSGDDEERKAAAEDVNRRFGEQVYDLWTSWTVWSIGHKPEVKGIAAGALPDGFAEHHQRRCRPPGRPDLDRVLGFATRPA